MVPPTKAKPRMGGEGVVGRRNSAIWSATLGKAVGDVWGLSGSDGGSGVEAGLRFVPVPGGLMGNMHAKCTQKTGSRGRQQLGGCQVAQGEGWLERRSV